MGCKKIIPLLEFSVERRRQHHLRPYERLQGRMAGPLPVHQVRGRGRTDLPREQRTAGAIIDHPVHPAPFGRGAGRLPPDGGEVPEFAAALSDRDGRLVVVELVAVLHADIFAACGLVDREAQERRWPLAVVLARVAVRHRRDVDILETDREPSLRYFLLLFEVALAAHLAGHLEGEHGAVPERREGDVPTENFARRVQQHPSRCCDQQFSNFCNKLSLVAAVRVDLREAEGGFLVPREEDRLRGALNHLGRGATSTW
mmetsp:Transcript_8515/g.17510  ORF Transcript_8515/g.17510 Transcript_8515/m.17510 type:complete len:258 (-) Transcript_8515:60-833(-)